MTFRRMLPCIGWLGVLLSTPAVAQDASTVSTYSLYVYAGIKVLSSTGGGVCAAVVMSQSASGAGKQMLLSSSQMTQVFVCLAISTPEAALLALAFDNDEDEGDAPEPRSPNDPQLLKLVRAQVVERSRELTTEVAVGSGATLEELAALIEYAALWSVDPDRFGRCVRTQRAKILPGLSSTDLGGAKLDQSARQILTCAHRSQSRQRRRAPR